jgi:hypothetical protein
LLDTALGSDSFKAERKRKREIEKEYAYLLQDMSLPHLVSLFLFPPFQVQLIGNSNNNNTSINSFHQ